MHTSNRNAAGFTLLEIMVALVILAGGLVMVARASHHILGALGHSRETLRAGILLRERMAELRGDLLMDSQEAPRPGSGRFAAPFDDYEWSLDVADVPLDTRAVEGRLSEITLRVRRIDGTPVGSGAGFMFQPE